MSQRDVVFPDGRQALYEINKYSAVAKTKAFAALPYPSWTAVGVNWLAGFDFEIKVIARIPQK